MMRTVSSLSLAAAAATVFLLLLLTTTMEVQAIRLDAESRTAVNQQQQVNVVANKPSEKDLMRKDSAGDMSSSPAAAAAAAAAGESETKRRSITAAAAASVAGQEEVVKATAHKLPEFHEDYYGASVHEPRHH